MAEWFETSKGRFINLERAFYAGPLYGKGDWGVWGTGDDEDYVIVDEQDVPRLRARLRQLATADGETPTATRYRYDER